MGSTAFYAYPAGNRIVVDAITGAVELSKSEQLALKPWQKMQIFGFKLDDLIRDEITEADALVGDITHPNPNVFYELGFAIAKGKPIIPTVNAALEGSVQRVQALGLFDNVGWLSYSNAEELSNKLRQWEQVGWTSRYTRRRDHEQPLFILDTLMKTDFRNHIIHAVDNSQVQYRKFDPADIPRLTAAQALAEVSASAGVIIPLIHPEIIDADRHNLRAAFLLGLCHGYEIEPLAIQYEHTPAPTDYRDFIRNSTVRFETEKHVAGYCAETLIWNQRSSARDRQPSPGILSEIDLGSPAAENETQQLNFYFVETAEFARALRAEGAVVIGRKGSGKSAVFLQVAQARAKDRRTCVVDLRPASHNLSEMREALLGVTNVGLFQHTVAAFWQYIISVEILLKIREMVLPRSRNDGALQQRIRQIEESFGLTDSVVSGDFTSRLATAVKEVISIIEATDNVSDLKQKITNMMFEAPIPRLREAISSFRDFFTEIVVLIDDLDKGWPPRQVEPHDIMTVRQLIEGMNRLQNDIRRRRQIEFRHLIFLRSDIYERLVEQTSDRGKYNPIKVDWSDPEQLRHLLRQRVYSSPSALQHDAMWDAFNPPIANSDAVGLLIEASLRRPRFLIDLCERTLSFAINRGHHAVSSDDIEEGMRQMSLYLVSDFGYELRDVAGTPEDIFYLFLGKPELLTEQELESILSDDRLGLGVKETVDLLLWYGFLGIIGPNSEPIFIYDRAYDFRRLEAEKSAEPDEALYAVNTAFLRGLRKT